MTKSERYQDDPAHAEARNAWNTNAAFWDDFMGEGNDWHLELVAPPVLRLLDPQPGQHILDIACGNGLFARRLARAGARVLACDFAEQQIERARTRTPDEFQVDYRVVDATDRDQFLALGERQFDGAVSNMALMDMAAVEPLFEALSRLLKMDGRFVFATSHPCFNSGRRTYALERTERDGEMIREYSVKVSNYITPSIDRGQAIRGQPVLQPLFHRPLHQFLNAAFDAGFLLDRIEEPVFAEDENDRSFGREIYAQIPPVLVARLRLPD